jgi:hypoxia up-regulated 1
VAQEECRLLYVTHRCGLAWDGCPCCGQSGGGAGSVSWCFLSHQREVQTIATVELISWLLMEAKDAAKHHTKSNVIDAVISVPPFFTHWERQDILTAAHMAGLNVLSLMNENTACATDYYLTRTIGNATGNIVLFDMGDVATKVSLLQFTRDTVEKTKKDVIEATVVDVTWDDSLGGRNFDETLAQHLAVLATKQTGEDIAKNPKAMEKLRAEAQRVKEVLSANTDIEARVEGILYDTYFSAKVSLL